ncbi:MAG: sigma-70 family RNA polymerase sigma factor [Anaeromyxobacteraceae bacterium]
MLSDPDAPGEVRDAGRPSGSIPGVEEWALVEALQAGDEAAFLALVDRYHAEMVRVASTIVRTRASAEDVVQEAWLGVVQRVHAFESRSSVRTWLFRIVTNCAKGRRARERDVPFSALAEQGAEEGPTVDPDRFHAASETYAGQWSRPPEAWADDKLAAHQAARRVHEEIERLPAAQRAVIVLRDVEGLSSEEVCESLGISDGNQRVLLHRARARVRAAVEALLAEGGRP